jgi:DHA1 family multidrug/chloramphenicol efflux transport protein-like MFS transporter
MIDKEKKRKMRLYIFVFFFVMYEAITYASNDMIMPGMLDVVSQFHVSVGYVASSMSIFILGNTVLQLFLGPAADRYGKKIIILIGNFFFLFFTIFIALSGSINQFMFGRLLQGSGCAFIAMGYSIIHEKFDDKTAVKIIALMANVTILAPLLGPVVGGIIVSLASWRYVFIVIGVVAFISLCGLIRYTPQSKKVIHRICIKDITLTYCSILKNRNFAIGCFAICFAILPLIAWIALAPVLIMKTADLSFVHYIVYQIIALGGLSLASIAMQFIAGKFPFYKIMITGNSLFIIGAFFSLVLSHSPLLLAIGFFINSFGLGFFNGIAFRIIMSNRQFSQSMTISLLVFIQTIAMAGGIEIVNLICGKFGFSLFSFALINFIFSISASMFIYHFAKMNKNREWV